ncbi:MAG: hypothetical protein IJ849_09835 [Selenomonadaceae bacterium]|nr:hypothetical protein [Selenomonadaceae bacterium]
MCEALRDFMREDLEAAHSAGYNEAFDTFTRSMAALGYDDAAIKAVTALSSETIAKGYSQM